MLTTARMGKFSSDRAVAEYAEEVSVSEHVQVSIVEADVSPIALEHRTRSGPRALSLKGTPVRPLIQKLSPELGLYIGNVVDCRVSERMIV